ncbi:MULTISPECIES: MFS transporter [Variovorax]|uniref:MFS transporter n=1 Tax=Variovorax TaxID=34072 RepID=UPI002854B0E7|nr:MFS transporter [Variovorax sp. 3319]MDR6890664.1 MFS family permease [Variovorax sp. 3319]
MVHALSRTATNESASFSLPSSANSVPRGYAATAVLGNALEFYDFVTYAFFAVFIGQAFFPASSPSTSLLLSVAVFGVGFIARPLGGVLVGMYADRVGRRPAMLWTMWLITLSTLGLALTPSYAAIGLAAPAAVVAFRLLQGFAIGGGIGPTTAFLVESAPLGRRGLFASFQLASQGAAAFVAGVAGIAMHAITTPEQMASWGWRVPFLVGLVMIPVALYARRRLPETLLAPCAKAGTWAGSELHLHRRTIVLSVFVVAGATVSTYVVNFMTTYAMTTLKLSTGGALSATLASGLATCVFALLGGWLSDRCGRKGVMVWPRAVAALITVPSFMLLVHWPSAVLLVLVASTLAALTALSAAGSFAAIPELLPAGVRATGLAIAYGLGVCIFGGSTQFVVAWLTEFMGSPLMPAWYVAGTSLVTLVAMMALPESNARDRG